MPDPTGKPGRDLPACDCVLLVELGDAGQTREVSPRTSCVEQFTPIQLVVLHAGIPVGVHTGASVHRSGVPEWSSRRHRGELGGCGGRR
ncbi:hypothetical protein X011_07890 [Mycobacterium tuberculosis variant microti OV254]|nr:hypothetical protein X011_07890 [Mycobacterium tuberculosis variant microti OV254]